MSCKQKTIIVDESSARKSHSYIFYLLRFHLKTTFHLIVILFLARQTDQWNNFSLKLIPLCAVLFIAVRKPVVIAQKRYVPWQLASRDHCKTIDCISKRIETQKNRFLKRCSVTVWLPHVKASLNLPMLLEQQLTYFHCDSSSMSRFIFRSCPVSAINDS